MSHRRAAGRSALLALSLLLQTVLVALPTPSASAAKATASSPVIERTRKDLPTTAERLGEKDVATSDAEYVALAPEDESGELQADGSFRLPRNYAANADAPTAAANGTAYAEQRQEKSERKDGGGGGTMRLDVSGDITANTTWTAANSPYVVTGTMNVQSPAVLTIEPGVVVKLDTGASLLAQAGATLNAIGTAANPIIFTSYKDDSAGGDDNGDGAASSPAPGDWNTLGYAGYHDVSGGHAALGSMQFAQVRYGQQFQARFSMPTLADDTIEKLSLYGFNLDTPPGSTYTIQRLTIRENPINLTMWAVPSTTTIKDSSFRGATGLTAIQASSSTAVRLTSNAIERNGPGTLNYAIQSASSPMVLRYNSIAYNRRASDGADMGISASGSTVDAQFNWWGSTSGPEVSGQSATGGGSRISTLVTYTSWLGSAFEVDHKRGNFPWTAKAGVGADVASGNFVFTEKDLSIPTIGFPLEAARTYNNQSAATVTGDFGYGWTWTYGTNLNTAADANGGYAWEQPDGAKSYFKKNGDGTFTPEQGVYSRLSYDGASQTYTLTHKDQTRWVFSSAGKLLQQIDTDGNATTIARDGAGKIQTVTEPTGQQLTVLYSGSFISKITDPLGRTYNYTYGSANSVTGVTKKEPDGTTVFNTCSYTYTGAATALTSLTDCDGNVLTQTYDASKRVVTQTWNGSTPQTRFVYGPGTDVPTGLTFPQYSTGVFDAYGKAHVYYYTKSNKVFEHWREKQILGGTYYWYTEDLWTFISYLSSSYRDIESKTTTYVYDLPTGNLLSKTEPGSRTTSYTYDAFNNRTSVTDDLGRTTAFAYDAEQHLTTITDALDHETTTTYTAAGLAETVTDARGKVTSFTADAYGYPATVTNAESEVLTFHYDAGARKLWQETPEGKRTTYTYNGRDQVLTATDPLSHVTTTVYDTASRKTSATDAESRTTTYSYQRNQLWKTTDAKSGVVEFTLSGAGDVASVKEAANHTTTFTWDQFGRKLTETDPNGKTFTYEYTYAGRISKVTDAQTGTVTYTYTAANDLLSISYSDGKAVSFTQDDVGNRLTMTDWNGTHTWVYDDLNRVTSATDAAGNTVGYGFDQVGNLTTITYPGSKTVTYAFDDANRLLTITDWDSRVTTYALDGSGRIGSFTLPNGVVTTYGYDDASRTAHVDHTRGAVTIASRDYTFDNVSNRATVTHDGSGVDTFTYDELHRITGVTYADGAQQSFTLDASGNRLTQTLAGGTTTYTYDAADQLTNAGDGVRAFDLNGQLTKIGAHRGFTWDVRGKLTQVTDAPTNTAPTANAGSNQTVYEDRLVLLDGRASSDPEGEPLSFAWTEDGANPQTGLLHGAASPQPGVTPATPGTYVFRLTVSDGALTSAQASVTITVQAGAPPTQVLSSTAAAAASGYVYSTSPTGRMFTNDVRAGKNGATEYRGAAQFILPSIPAGTFLSAATLDLMGKSNTGNAATDVWSVDLLPTSVDANWNTTASWNTIGTVTPDSTLSPTLVGLNQVVANSLDSWTFASGDLAVLTSRLGGSGKLSVRTKGVVTPTTDYVNWYGGNATTATNRPKLTLTFSPSPEYDHDPIARAGRDQTAATGTLVTLHGEDAYDYEDASVTHAWTQLGGPSVTLSSSSAASPTFTPTAPGFYRFRDTVSDAASHTATDEMVVTVLPQLPPHVTGYAYNGDGDRISQTADGVTTAYVVNSVPTLAQVLMETTAGQTTYYVYGHDLLSSVKADGPHYHHADSLGSTIAVTDSTGAVEQTMDYDVFGVLRSITGSNGTTYTFTGEENDASGLIYLRARYYDPASGRFLSRDPYPMEARDTQTINRYVYVKNNPTNYVDPSGEFALLTVPAAFHIKQQWLNVFPKEGLEGSVRHAMSSKYVTSEYGAVQAFGAGAANEAWPGVKGTYWGLTFRSQKAFEKRVDSFKDLWNNQEGINAQLEGRPIEWQRLLVQDGETLRPPTDGEIAAFMHRHPEYTGDFTPYESMFTKTSW